MEQEILLEEYKKAHMEVVKEDEKRDFISHLVIYIIVNIALIIVNFTYSPENIWFSMPLIFWGIGLLMHYLYGVRWVERALKEDEIKAEHRAREMRKN